MTNKNWFKTIAIVAFKLQKSGKRYPVGDEVFLAASVNDRGFRLNVQCTYVLASNVFKLIFTNVSYYFHDRRLRFEFFYLNMHYNYLYAIYKS